MNIYIYKMTIVSRVCCAIFHLFQIGQDLEHFLGRYFILFYFLRIYAQKQHFVCGLDTKLLSI